MAKRGVAMTPPKEVVEVTDEIKKNGFSRRSFLQGSATLCAGLTLSRVSLFGLTGSTFLSATGERVGVDITSPRTFTYNVCPRNCYDTCSLISEKVNGRIVRILGDPDNPFTAGTPCIKGHTHINVVYHPDRLLHPMKRAGKKGEGKWEKISWDEAYDTITKKFKDIIATDGGEAIVPYTFSGTFGQIHQFGVPWRFFNKIGATTIDREVCLWAGLEALGYTYGDASGAEPEDCVKSDCYISWGGNEANTSVHAVKFINQARDKGAKFVVVNPHRHALASQADLFIQLRPGTDAAFALGVAKVLIDENLYDKDFVEKYTLGFDKLKEKVNQYPLPKVAKITGVPESQIVEFARLYAKTKKSMLRMGYGFQRRKNGGSIIRAVSLLPALIGSIGVDGGGFQYVNFNHWPMDMGYMNRPDLLAGRKVRNINMNEVGKALTGNLPTVKEKPIKALFVFSGNPIPSGTNINLTRQGLQREDLFTVVFDQFVTDTAEYADILLPAGHFLEMEEVHANYLGNYVRYNAPALPPMGESKSNLQVFHELAQRMGYTEDCFKETTADVIKGALNSNNPALKGITYESLKAKHWFRVNLGVPFADRKFKTPSGKVEFYSEAAGKKGFDPVAEYVPDMESIEASPELYSKYPIHLVTPASQKLLSSQWHNVPYIQESLGEPTITINTADAHARGIKNGDYANVFNDRGRVRLKVKVSEAAVRPGVAMSYKSYWDKLTGGNTINRLVLDENADMGGGAAISTNLVQVTKA
jgi:anaerobic selenocysteine-containing dehydrogenase